MTEAPAWPVSESIRDVIANAHLCVVAVASLCAWDWLALLPLEYRFISSARWTPLKVAYLVNRYWTLILMAITVVFFVAELIRVQACSSYGRVMPGGTIVTVTACSTILTIRTWAFYAKSMRILAILCVFMVCQIGVMAFATSRFLMIAFPRPLRGCVYTGSLGKQGYLVAFWAVPLAFNTTVILLTIYRTAGDSRQALFVLKLIRYLSKIQIRQDTGSGRRGRVVTMFLSDAGFYFVVILAVNVLNIALFSQSDEMLQPFGQPFATGLTSLMARPHAARIVLHLHSTSNSADTSTTNPAVYLPAYAMSPLPSSPKPIRPYSTPLRTVKRSESPFRRNHSPSTAPIVSMLTPGAELPLSVRVALRGIGNDESELGIEESKEERYRRRRDMRSTSVAGVRVERETVAVVEREESSDVEVGRSRAL
ncbi:hypothetical protein MNV49_000088 [Pseudohyphozyma bogoriensis]|nr:hypothetical protein MNV49_000088 [Pseudohyphozyma bogoriensis]